MPKTRYVCGFLFNPECDVVALIRKNRPQWQAGKLNGIGGHIEPGETADQAMRREFREEAGVDHADWAYLTTLTGPDWEVVFYRAFTNDVFDIQSCTDEPVGLFDPTELPGNTLPNLRELIPLAMHPVLTAKAA